MELGKLSLNTKFPLFEREWIKAVDDKVREAKLKAKSEARLAAMVRKEAAYEAQRVTKEAIIAIKVVKEAKKAEAKTIRRDVIIARQKKKRRATTDQSIKQAEVELTEEFELADMAKKEAREAATKAKEIKETDAQLYEGTIYLILMPPAGVRQIKNLEESLSQTKNARIILTRGSIDEPTNVILSIDRPIPLIDILHQMPIVDHVKRKGREIQIFLKAGV